MEKGISRRKFLVLTGAASAAVALDQAHRAVDAAFKITDTIDARQHPNQKDNIELKNFMMSPELVNKMYHENMESYVDPIDNQPIISLGTWTTQMYWFNKITSVLYNQFPRKKVVDYEEFAEEAVKTTFSLCGAAELHPAVFFQTVGVSGQNLGGPKNQEGDVGTFAFQTVMMGIDQNLDQRIGSNLIKTLQFHLSNPHDVMFKGDFKKKITEIANKFGLLQGDGFGSELRPEEVYNTLRLLNPTVGMMDMEPSVYAEAIYNSRERFPDFFATAFARNKNAVNALLTLYVVNQRMEQQRNALGLEIKSFLKKNPHIVDTFLSDSSGLEQMQQIGIGEVDFQYNVASEQGIRWDGKFMDTAVAKLSLDNENITSTHPDATEFNRTGIRIDYTKLFKDEEAYFAARKKFVLSNTFKYFHDMYQQNPDQTRELFFRDQVFNDGFINWLDRQPVKAGFGELLQARDNFDLSVDSAKNARFETLKSLGLLEYEETFQLGLLVGVTKNLQTKVENVIPEVSGDLRNQLYWQMYFIDLIREIAPFPRLTQELKRPDIDPPYNPEGTLSKFRDYYKPYEDQHVVPVGALPNDFAAFAIAERRYYRSHWPEAYGDQGLAEEEKNAIYNAYTKWHGRGIYSAWLRANDVADDLNITR